MREVQTQNVSNVTAGGELHLQQESYHSTQTPIVTHVTSNERAVITREIIAGNDGTLRSALGFWNSRQGPVGYNQWVSAFFALTRDFRMIDTEKPAGENQVQKQRRINQMYHQIQRDIHGADYKILALERRASAMSGVERDQRRIAALGLPGRGQDTEGRAAPTIEGPATEARASERAVDGSDSLALGEQRQLNQPGDQEDGLQSLPALQNVYLQPEMGTRAHPRLLDSTHNVEWHELSPEVAFGGRKLARGFLAATRGNGAVG